MSTMDINNHRRYDSASSFLSFHAEDIEAVLHDLTLDGDIIPQSPSSTVEKEPSDQPLLLRERLGPSMSIIAATSPDIKALNLRITPSFPETLDYSRSHSCSNGSTMSIIAATSPDIKALNLRITPSFPDIVDYCRGHSFSSGSADDSESSEDPRSNKTKDKRSRLLETMCDVDDSPLLATRYNQKLPRVSLEAGEMDALSPSSDIVEYPKRAIPFHHDGNKENISPKMLFFKAGSLPNVMKKEQLKEYPVSRSNSDRVLRVARHRRASFDSLPSPAEIGPSPKGRSLAGPHQAKGKQPYFFPPDMDDE